MDELSTQKQLMDYLHLYLGCEIENHNGEYRGTFTGFRLPVEAIIYISGLNKSHIKPDSKDYGEKYFLAEKMKPILRPLSDMTDDEKVLLVEEVIYNHVRFSSKESALGCFDEEEYAQKIQHHKFYVDEVNWLRKRFFDVDRLIESGLAIDVTKVKQYA